MGRTSTFKALLAGFWLLVVLGGTAFLRVDAPSAQSSLAPQPQAPSCGKERWGVKIGTDSGALSINLNSSQPANVADLITRNPPSPLPEDSRFEPTETTVYVVTASLQGYKLEADQDYHLVLVDAKNNTMIAEIPSPSCVRSTSSPFVKKITDARHKFDTQFGGRNLASATYRTLKPTVPVIITGVGFFDKLHGQTGVAPNGIELHPVLDIEFPKGTAIPIDVSSAPPQATAVPTRPPQVVTLPTPTPAPPVATTSAGPLTAQWEYNLKTGRTAEELFVAVQALGPGWELVTVVIDDKRTDRYVAYLKRTVP